MTDLIERLEKAAENTRRLFEEVYLAIRARPCWDDGDDGYFFQQLLDVGAWESAALLLLPAGCGWIVGHGREGPGEPLGGARIHAGLSGTCPVLGEAEATTPALALCIAALKSRHAQESPDAPTP